MGCAGDIEGMADPQQAPDFKDAAVAWFPECPSPFVQALALPALRACIRTPYFGEIQPQDSSQGQQSHLATQTPLCMYRC